MRVLLLIAFVAGVMIGLAASVWLFIFRIEVDYYSGRARNVMMVGPIKVRYEDRESAFGALKMPNNRTSVAEGEKWRIAASFRRNAKVTAQREAGLIWNQINGFNNLIPLLKLSDAAIIKHEFLTLLESSGAEVALGYLASNEVVLIQSLGQPTPSITPTHP